MGEGLETSITAQLVMEASGHNVMCHWWDVGEAHQTRTAVRKLQDREASP